MNESPTATSQPSKARRRHRFLIVMVVVGILMLLLDLPIHNDPHFHPHFPEEGWFGFYGWLAAASCLGLVIVARVAVFLLPVREATDDV